MQIKRSARKARKHASHVFVEEYFIWAEVVFLKKSEIDRAVEDAEDGNWDKKINEDSTNLQKKIDFELVERGSKDHGEKGIVAIGARLNSLHTLRL